MILLNILPYAASSDFLVNNFSNLSSSVHTGGNLQSHPHTVKGIDASIVENKVIFSHIDLLRIFCHKIA